MSTQNTGLSSIEVRNLMFDVLSYEGDDLDWGNTFKAYGYQGTQSGLYRLLESLAIKRGLISDAIPVARSAWGASGELLHAGSSTNFNNMEIRYLYEQFHLLLNQGVIAPGANGNMGPNLPCFHVTEHGLKCLDNKEFLPLSNIVKFNTVF